MALNKRNLFSEKEGYPDSFSFYEVFDNYVECTSTNGLKMRLYFYGDSILRFRYAIEGIFEEDFSYAIDPNSKFETPKFTVKDNSEFVVIETETVICRIGKTNFHTTILDHQHQIINEDEKGFHWEPVDAYGGYIVQSTKKVQAGEAFYGLGDKPIDLNLRGKRFKNWGTDEYGYHVGTDPIYKNIPFYYGLHNGIGYGIFFDNTYETHFDFGAERSGVSSFWAQGGEMNYYFIIGPELMDVAERYTQLTGTPDMPPLWSLGYQQCKWSYYPEDKVWEIADKMRALEIPCDAIYLDIDYMDGFRCFTWDKEKFPNPKKMIAELKEKGFKTMVMIDPGIKKDKSYWIYNEGVENNYFCRRIDGPFVEGKVWPGVCHFPDFTNPEVRSWWGELYQEMVEEQDVAGVWNDMNEPALFEVENKTFPNDVVHHYDGHQTSHRKAHNVYGMQMVRASAEGMKKFKKEKRTLLITRSAYAGVQRYSSVWTGDNIASWEHLWLADVQAQRLAISGISFCGSDIGGFIETPSPELMIRWIQLGIFHPFCRVHSSGDHGDQEPWSFGDECTNIFRKYIELRYQLLPYIYTAFYQYHKSGTPILRPLVFIDQKDHNTVDRDHEFMCGDHILVCPVLKPDVKTRRLYLTRGEWYDFWTNENISGGQEQEINTPIEQIPMLIKAGAIIPIFPVQQYVGEKVIEEVSLKVYFKLGAEKSMFYQDDNETNYYEQGDFRLNTLELSGSNDSLTINQSITGDHMASNKTYKLELIGLPFEPTSIEIDGKKILFSISNDLIIPSNFKHLKIT